MVLKSNNKNTINETFFHKIVNKKNELEKKKGAVFIMKCKVIN